MTEYDRSENIVLVRAGTGGQGWVAGLTISTTGHSQPLNINCKLSIKLDGKLTRKNCSSNIF